MDYENLIIKILSGKANNTDIRSFNDWLNQSKKNEEEFYKLKNLWDLTHPTFDPQSIDINKASKSFFNNIKKRERENKTRKLITFIYRVAAILFIPLVLSTIYLYTKVQQRNNYSEIIQAYQTINIPYGMISSLELPDGSKVWLNAGSSFKYPIQFDEKIRKVELIKGEAFFEVNSDIEHPFIVNTENINVIATGTRFNVSSYPEDENIYVSLDKGKVEISGTQYKNILHMSPGETICMDKKSNTYFIDDKTCIYNRYAWIDGITIFRNTKLEEVFKRLSKIYNVDFIINDDEINSYPYHATFKNESLDEILNIIEMGNSIVCKEIKNNTSYKRKYAVSLKHKQ